MTAERVRAAKVGGPVYVDDQPLDLASSLQVWNHSPSGFAWGYGGSGPAQLALALLLRSWAPETASRLHQAFKWDVVAQWDPTEPLDEIVDIAAWVVTHELENRAKT